MEDELIDLEEVEEKYRETIKVMKSTLSRVRQCRESMEKEIEDYDRKQSAKS